MDDVARIARGLSEAQRKALRAAEWSMIRQYEAGILELLRFGLLQPDGLGHSLSQRGLSVRRYLEENPDAG